VRYYLFDNVLDQAYAIRQAQGLFGNYSSRALICYIELQSFASKMAFIATTNVVPYVHFCLQMAMSCERVPARSRTAFCSKDNMRTENPHPRTNAMKPYLASSVRSPTWRDF
jgi:hypothetical protein